MHAHPRWGSREDEVARLERDRSRDVGDQITLDVANKRLDVEIADDELARRKEGWEPNPPKYTSGVLAKYRKLVSSAAHGAVTG